MGDSYRLKAKCLACGHDLEKDQDFPLFVPPGESVNLTCEKCGAVWKFSVKVKIEQKKLGRKKNLTKSKRCPPRKNN